MFNNIINYLILISNNCIDSSKLTSSFRAYTNVSDLLIENCYFTRFSCFNQNGGIIYCEDKEAFLILKEVDFYICYTTGFGGAIYFDNQISGSGSNLNKVCADLCFSTTNTYAEQFGFFSPNNSTNSPNKFTQISISRCSNFSRGYCSILISLGNISINYLNSSNNYNLMTSGFHIYEHNNFQAIFCSIVKNVVTNRRLIQLDGGFNNTIKYSNFLNNTGSFDFGIISIIKLCSYLIENSYFLNNKDCLFYSTIGELFILNCFIDHKDLLLSGNVYLENSSLINLTETLNFLINSCFYNPTATPTASLHPTATLTASFNPTLIQTIQETIIPTKTIINTKNSIFTQNKFIIAVGSIFIIALLILVIGILLFKNNESNDESESIKAQQLI